METTGYSSTSFPVGDCGTSQGNVYHQVSNARVISSDADSSLQMMDSPNVQVVNQTLSMTQNSSAFLPDTKIMPQQFTQGASLHPSQGLTFYKEGQTSNVGQKESTTDEHLVKSNNILSERVQRVPCSNPDECPTGGKCYLFTET